MTKIISITNRKGGVGKSTLSILLAGCLARDNKVLILDCDEQRSVEGFYNLERGMYESDPLFAVEGIALQFVYDFLRAKGDQYDIILIDVPRFTSGSDSATMQVLGYCDAVLIPCLGSTLEVLSTIDFIKAVQVLADYKEKNDIAFRFHGVMNRVTRRSENRDTKQILSDNGLSMFESELPDIKLFTNPSTHDCILNSKDGKERFADFYNEFITKLID